VNNIELHYSFKNIMQILTISTAIAAPLFYPSRDSNVAIKESVASAIRKTPTSTMDEPKLVEIRKLGVVGDEQADLSVHGGLDKAVYLYPAEHYAFWETVSQQTLQPTPLAHGKMGENLTITGLNEKNVWVGDILAIGSVRLRVESPRNPCFKFNAVMGFKHATKMMVQSGYCGFYCSVVQPGFLTAGDKITVTAGDRVISIEQRFAIGNRSRQSDLFS
jgi:MOSC domain-containing protein YiiM